MTRPVSGSVVSKAQCFRVHAELRKHAATVLAGSQRGGRFNGPVLILPLPGQPPSRGMGRSCSCPARASSSGWCRMTPSVQYCIVVRAVRRYSRTKGGVVRVENSRDDGRKALFSAVRDLHRRHGAPSSRELATAIGGISHSTVNDVIRGERLPTWPVLSKIVIKLNGDEEVFRALWMDAKEGPGGKTEAPAGIGGIGAQVSVFVSYARVDDEATYGRIGKFITDVRNSYCSITGVEVEIFKDTDSISVGQNWQDRIRLGLADSSVFIAFVSPAYMRSVACREEFREFYQFLSISSNERLIIPLIFADMEKIEARFANDSTWTDIKKLEVIKVGDLRYVESGTERWMRFVDQVANEIDDILSSLADKVSEPSVTVGVAEEDVQFEQVGMLEKMAAFEEVLPRSSDEMQRLGQLIEAIGDEASDTAPALRRADKFSQKLSLSTEFAVRIEPICDEIATLSGNLCSALDIWDDGLKSIFEIAKKSSGPLDPEFIDFFDIVKDTAVVGIESLGELENLHKSIGSILGMSAKLDRQLRRLQKSVLEVVELRAFFKGWSQEITIIESLPKAP